MVVGTSTRLRVSNSLTLVIYPAQDQYALSLRYYRGRVSFVNYYPRLEDAMRAQVLVLKAVFAVDED